MSSSAPFGHQLRDQFSFGEKFINLNHGSFGSYPKVVRDQFRTFQDLSEREPDRFMRYDHVDYLDKSRAAIAKLINCSIDEVVFVANATTGVNTILRNLTYDEKDFIIHFNTIYSACGKTVSYLCDTTPAKSQEVRVEYPISDRELVQKFREAVRSIRDGGGNPKIAVFDTVTSLPGIRMPFESLVEACKEAGVLSLVDGAHGIGHVPLDMEKVQPDFLTSNCHKWLYLPRGNAILYVPLRNQKFIRSSVPTSHYYEPLDAAGKFPNPLPSSEKSTFVKQFEFMGTVDTSSFLCAPTALKFRQDLGGEEKIFEYCSHLARKGGQEIAKILGTEVMENEEGTLGNCCMSTIRLPFDVGDGPGQIKSTELAAAGQKVQGKLRHDHPTFIPIFCDGKRCWARVSGQIYLELEDFVWGGEKLKTVCQEIAGGQVDLPIRSA